MEKFNIVFKIARIISKEKIEEITDEEKIILQKWLDESEKNRKLYNDLKQELSGTNIEELNIYNSEKAFRKIRKSISADKRNKNILFIPNILKYVASVIILFACGYLVYNKISEQTGYQYTARYIKPGTQKAILTTSDNQKIELGRLKHKTVYVQKNSTIVDTNAILTYQAIPAVKKELFTEKYNQLETPKGGEYTLVLTDGTKIMLNSASKLKFPETFDGSNTREVELTGEAYFEVKKMKDKSFIVHTGNLSTTVYGTSFNISAYDDDDNFQTTLVEGIVGVSVTQGDKTVEYKLSPGLQAVYNKTTSNIITSQVNPDIYIAWTKGMFLFDNESIENILKRLARWYNLEIEYSDDIIKNEFFTGEINIKRYDNISKILEMLSIASDIRFKINSRKLFVYAEK